MANFKDKIHEGDLHSIENLKIVPSNESYRPVNGSNKEWFLLTIDVNKNPETEVQIPRHYFEYASIQTLRKVW